MGRNFAGVILKTASQRSHDWTQHKELITQLGTI